MASQQINFRLPFDDWPLAVFETDFRFRGGTLKVEGQKLLAFGDREALSHGGSSSFRGQPLVLKIEGKAEAPEIALIVGGRRAVREDQLRLRATRSAWIHATIALLASGFGFVASYLYLLRAEALSDAWALKMAIHTAGWHLLLTLTLFPASVFGQQVGIRAVQVISLLFFLIHGGMALANMDATSAAAMDGPGIATFNALSGLFFLFAVIYGQRAHRDMSPAALFKPD